MRTHSVSIATDGEAMRDLAPMILRQRLVIEGTCRTAISSESISEYLIALGDVCDMTILTTPVLHRSDLYGWAGWVHWETSGVHFYAWDQPVLFFSVDIYTCKAFDAEATVAFTQRFFDATAIEARSF